MVQSSTDALYRWIVDSAVDGIVCADREGIIRVWNRGAQAFLGYAADEAIGQSMNLILPERCRERHWQAFHRWFAPGDDLPPLPGRFSIARRLIDAWLLSHNPI